MSKKVAVVNETEKFEKAFMASLPKGYVQQTYFQVGFPVSRYPQPCYQERKPTQQDVDEMLQTLHETWDKDPMIKA